MIDFTRDELLLLVEALDSHEYWQLSDSHYRRDGSVDIPGADSPERAKEILRARRLRERIEAMAR